MSDPLLYSRLLYLASELPEVDLPPEELTRQMGKSWHTLIRGAANVGAAGLTAIIPGTSLQSINDLIATGSEGPPPSPEEFRAGIAGVIYERICASETLGNDQKIDLVGKLWTWKKGRVAMIADEVLDWDAEVETPEYTRTGFFPLDNLFGGQGVPSDSLVFVGPPGVGKTTLAIKIGACWRELDIGQVVLLEPEMPPSMMSGKIKSLIPNMGSLFRPGIDKIVYGANAISKELDYMIERPDSGRLVLFDGLSAYCGQGDDPSSRIKYAELVMQLNALKIKSRCVIAFHHVKRGLDGKIDLESAAGSSVVERFFASFIEINKSACPRPDGSVRVYLKDHKHRYGDGTIDKVPFLFNYATGEVREVPQLQGVNLDDDEE